MQEAELAEESGAPVEEEGSNLLDDKTNTLGDNQVVFDFEDLEPVAGWNVSLFALGGRGATGSH